MKAVILLLALAPVMAQAGPWEPLFRDKNGAVLLDKGSIRNAADGRKAWTMQSFRKAQTGPDARLHLSVRSLYVYDCDSATRTLLSQTFHADVLGKGEPVGTFKYEAYDPEAIEPGTPAEKALKAVCKKR